MVGSKPYFRDCSTGLRLLACSCAETILYVSYGASRSDAPRIADFRSYNNMYQRSRPLAICDFILDHSRVWCDCVFLMSWPIYPLLLFSFGTSPDRHPYVFRWQSLSIDYLDCWKRNSYCIGARGVFRGFPNLRKKTLRAASEKVVQTLQLLFTERSSNTSLRTKLRGAPQLSERG